MALAIQVSGGNIEVGNNSIRLGAAYDLIVNTTKEDAIQFLGINEDQYRSFHWLVCKKLNVPAWHCPAGFRL